MRLVNYVTICKHYEFINEIHDVINNSSLLEIWVMSI